MMLSDLLPLDTVRDLTVKLRGYNKPQWPEAWDQLTTITRLELSYIPHTGGEEVPFLPPVRAQSLVNIEIFVHYYLFASSGEGYVKTLFGCLPLLSKLQIIVIKNAFLYGPERAAAIMRHRQLEAICVGVQSSKPGLVYTIMEEPVQSDPHFSQPPKSLSRLKFVCMPVRLT